MEANFANKLKSAEPQIHQKGVIGDQLEQKYLLPGRGVGI